MRPHRSGAKGLAVILVAGGLAVSARAADDEADHLASLPDGRRLHVSCVGAGAPTVVLESGLGLPMAVWNKVQPRLAPHLRVCAYDRAGYGTSDPGPMPRDAIHIATDLASLLKVERLPPPYVLVGHSLGGQFVRLFAAEHPDQVVGLVLVDPSFQDDDANWPQAAKASFAAEKNTIETCVGTLARARTWTAETPGYAVCGPPPSPAELVTGRAMAQASLSEFENGKTGAAQVLAATRKKQAYPIIVLTARRKSADPLAGALDLMVREHTAIAQTSTRGVDRVVDDASHLIQFEKPEAVVQAVEDVIAMAKADPPLSRK